MSILDKFRLLCPATVEETIGENSFTFYQCSPRMLATTAHLVAHLAGGVSVLFSDKNGDTGTTIQDYRDPETGEEGQTTMINAIDPQLANDRAERRSQAIKSLVTGLLQDDHRKALLGMIANSLRDDFPRKDKSAIAEGIDMLDEMDLGHFLQFFMGMMKANAGVFGELGKTVVDRMQKATAAAVGADDDYETEISESEVQETDG